MSALLRSLLVVGFAGLVLVGCGEKEEVAPADEAAAPVTTEAAPAAEAPAADSSAPATGGGYEPTAEERVPGITLDAAAAAPAEAPTAPAGTEAPAAP